MILHCPLVDAAHISPPAHFVWPTCLFLSYALLNVIICSTIQPFYFHPPSDGLVYPSCKFHVVIWVSYPLNHLFLAVSLSSCQPPSPPPVLLSSWHQTITLVLHPYSSLLPPPSKTLVLPLMKPKVSSTEAPETAHNYITVWWSFEREHFNHVLSTHFLDVCLYAHTLLLVKALGWDFLLYRKINWRLPLQLLAWSSLRSWSMHLTSFILIFSVTFVWHLVVLCVVGYRYLFRYFTHWELSIIFINKSTCRDFFFLKKTMLYILWFQPLSCQDLLLFSVSYFYKFNIFGSWIISLNWKLFPWHLLLFPDTL